MGSNISKYIMVVKVSLSNALAYRIAIYSRLCFYTLFVYVFMSLWGAIYKEGSVHGYTYTQIVWYLAMTEFVGYACTTDIYAVMNDEVKNGAIAYQLVRPTHYVSYQFANSIGQLIPNFVAFGVLGIALGLIFAGPLTYFSLAGILPLLLSLALGIALNFFIHMLIGLSSFVYEDNFALYLIYQKLTFMLGMFLPVEFLPQWLQPIAKALPFSYVHWAPAKLFVDYSPSLAVWLIIRQAGWVAAFSGLVVAIYRVCVARLQVNGG
ncbi:MAG: hypothetical protein FWG10_12205 [Eubacteriaceae bacterium]|nr:hypothetical protein [Eubacteriaceae bacterium]